MRVLFLSFAAAAAVLTALLEVKEVEVEEEEEEEEVEEERRHLIGGFSFTLHGLLTSMDLRGSGTFKREERVC